MRLGIIMLSYNETDSGIYYNKIALTIWEKQNNKTKLSRTCLNTGTLYANNKNYTDAKEYYLQALSNAQILTDSVYSYLGLCILFMQQKQFSNAYQIIKVRLNSYPKNVNRDLAFYILEGQGVYFLYDKKNYDSAIVYLKQSINVTNNQRLKANVYNDLAECYLQLKKNNIAFLYQDSAAVINNKLRDATNLLPFYETYTNLFKETGNYKQALYYAELHKNLSDSFFDADKYRALQDAEAKYQNQKTKAEKAIIEKDNKLKQRNLVFSFIGLGLVALLAVVSLRSASIRKKANTLLATQKLAVQKLADELTIANQTKTKLFSTISHDLRSPISSLYSYLKLQELKNTSTNDEISKSTSQLLDTLEDLLIWSKSQMDGFVLQNVSIDINKLVEELKEYSHVQLNIKNLNLINNTPANSSCITDENILKTILRNLLNNAISNSLHSADIIFDTQTKNNTTTLSIKNTCTKEAFAQLQKNYLHLSMGGSKHGLGIILIKEFAQKIGANLSLNFDGTFAIISVVIA